MEKKKSVALKKGGGFFLMNDECTLPLKRKNNLLLPRLVFSLTEIVDNGGDTNLGKKNMRKLKATCYIG